MRWLCCAVCSGDGVLPVSPVSFYMWSLTLSILALSSWSFRTLLSHFGTPQKPENILMRANGHIAVTDFDLSKQAHPVGPRIIQQQMKLSDKIRKSLSLTKTRTSSSSLVNLDIVNSEPVLPYQTNSFVGYVGARAGRLCEPVCCVALGRGPGFCGPCVGDLCVGDARGSCCGRALTVDFLFGAGRAGVCGLLILYRSPCACCCTERRSISVQVSSALSARLRG